VPPSNHHHAVTVDVAVARFTFSAPLLDFDATIQGDSSGFHDDVVVDCFGACDHTVNLLNRATERLCEFFVIRVETLIAQCREHVLSRCLIGPLVVNFLVEHHTLLSSVLFQITNVFHVSLKQVKRQKTYSPQKAQKHKKSRSRDCCCFETALFVLLCLLWRTQLFVLSQEPVMV